MNILLSSVASKCQTTKLGVPKSPSDDVNDSNNAVRCIQQRRKVSRVDR